MTGTAVAAPETVWLLDVDGVLNATRPGWSAAPRRVTACADATEWRIRFAPALMRRIRQVHATGLVEIVWCTTWCPWADQLERLLGLPALGRAWTKDLHGFAARDAKLAAARGVVKQGRRLIWTDDDAIPHDRSLFPRALLIAPDPRRGLQREDMDRIDAYVLAGGSGAAVA